MDTKPKQPYGLFPPDIWEVVVSYLNFIDTYTLAKTSKPMMEHLRHIPYEGIWNIPNRSLAGSTFLSASIRHINVTINANVVYNDLRQIFYKFHSLDSVTFTYKEIEMTASIANKLLLCLPKRHHCKLLLYVEQCDRSYFEEAITKSNKNGVILRSAKRKCRDDQDDEEERRRRRTPSPFREDVNELRGKIEDIKETFSGFAANPASVVPKALKDICKDVKFVDIDVSLRERSAPLSKSDADEFIAAVGGRLVECIAVSSKGSWIFVTQVEAYMRGAKEIDDCANTTNTITHPSKPKLIVEQKREFQNQWLEAKVYFKNFEFLITGCLCGTYNDDDDDHYDAFLGASLGNHLPSDDYWRVYVPAEAVPAVEECRLLRNFTKAASGFKWLLKSKRFEANGFGTACALNLCDLEDVDSIAAIGSLLLRWKVSDQKDKHVLRSMLSNVEELSELDVEATNESVDKVRQLKIAKGKKLALEMALLILGDVAINDIEYVEMFKALISSRLVTLNKQAIRQKKYLL